MPGTVDGGRKAAATNKKRYGLEFYPMIGRVGGLNSRGGGFAKNPELAAIAGRKGGASSRRSKGVELYRNGNLLKTFRGATQAAQALNVSASTIRYRIDRGVELNGLVLKRVEYK